MHFPLSILIAVTAPLSEEKPRLCYVPSHETAISHTAFASYSSIISFRNSSAASCMFLNVSSLYIGCNVFFYSVIVCRFCHWWWHIHLPTHSFQTCSSLSNLPECHDSTYIYLKGFETTTVFFYSLTCIECVSPLTRYTSACNFN